MPRAARLTPKISDWQMLLLGSELGLPERERDVLHCLLGGANERVAVSWNRTLRCSGAPAGRPRGSLVPGAGCVRTSCHGYVAVVIRPGGLERPRTGHYVALEEDLVGRESTLRRVAAGIKYSYRAVAV